MRHVEWMEPSPAEERRARARLNLRARPQTLHVRTAADGSLELVTGLNELTERSLKVPREMENDLLHLVFI